MIIEKHQFDIMRCFDSSIRWKASAMVSFMTAREAEILNDLSLISA